MPHNHPPRCCCEFAVAQDRDQIGEQVICTSCVIHGELAQLADNECPSCHQLPGRGPTDYCRQPRWHTTRGIVNEPQTYATKTTQPATRTTTPPTITRDMIEGPSQPNAYDVIQAERAQASRVAAGYCTECGSHNHRHMRGCTKCRHTVTEYDDNGRGTCRSCGEPTPLATPTPPARGIFDELSHTVFVGSRSTTHLRALCRPGICGQQPTPSQ